MRLAWLIPRNVGRESISILANGKKRRRQSLSPSSVTLIRSLTRLAASNGCLLAARQLPRPPTPTKAVLAPSVLLVSKPPRLGFSLMAMPNG